MKGKEYKIIVKKRKTISCIIITLFLFSTLTGAVIPTTSQTFENEDTNLPSDTIVIEAQDFNMTFRKEAFINKIEEIVYLTVSKIVLPGSEEFPIGADNWDKLILSG